MSRPVAVAHKMGGKFSTLALSVLAVRVPLRWFRMTRMGPLTVPAMPRHAYIPACNALRCRASPAPSANSRASPGQGVGR